MIKGLVKRYPGVVALDHADGVIVPGAIVGLLGKNGAGKSTLIKILAGVVQPDEGEIIVDGEPVRLHGPLDATRRGFAFVHQELTDVPNLTVAENIELGLGYPKVAGTFVKRRALRRKAAAVLERLGAQHRPEAASSARSRSPSGGMVVIARGLATNARLLVLDEPTASLTEEEIGHLHDVLRKLRDDGVAVLYVTHRLQEVYDLTDDVAVMRDGKMVFEAPTARGRAQPADRAHHREQSRGHGRALEPAGDGDRARGDPPGREPGPPRRRRGRELLGQRRRRPRHRRVSSAPGARSSSG